MGGNQAVSVSYSVAGGSSVALGSLTVYATPAVPSVTGALVSLPLRDFYRGNSFTASVSAYAGTYSINTFRMQVTTDANVQINSITYSSAVWGASILATSSNQYTITATPTSPLTRSVTASGPETLFQVSFSIVGSAGVNADAMINCSVFDLYDAKGVAVYSQFPSSATYYDRYGRNIVSGHVHVANNSVVGILPYVSQSELVNTAVITGTQVQSSMSVLGLMSDASTVMISSGLSCVSGNTGIVQVTSSCGLVYLTGSETSGSSKVGVSVLYGGFTSTVYARVVP